MYTRRQRTYWPARDWKEPSLNRQGLDTASPHSRRHNERFH
jgi:hypothetical protein